MAKLSGKKLKLSLQDETNLKMSFKSMNDVQF